ncbi:hypothetical protein HanXRQr2_Chr14g0646271 [Helianthus annuus]|uniref:Uncharacterized protein n=1 Tax=Helianthus annuus TaxID=4232 RepID=A0A9K3E983_HELAN|nr:hypothetical protein HanXRQr2_Chr14g0646271 [Helianthus annuus]
MLVIITLGSFGAITQFKSILPDRKTKVDISLAGPFVGSALSLSMFVVGLLLSLKPETTAVMVQVPSMPFQGSLLLGLFSRATLGYTYIFLLHNIARCWKMYSHAHDYNINCISINRKNLWNLEVSDQCFDIIDMKPSNIEDLTGD